MRTWEKIDDKHLVMVWKCLECDEVVEVSPSFYENNGTPVCIECDEDMAYQHAMVAISE